MLSEREHFKVAFLHFCAQRGLTLEETHQVVKQALVNAEMAKEALIKEPVQAGKAIVDTGKGLANWLLTAGLLTSAGIGAGGGYLLGRNSGLNDEDVKEIKQQELMSAYNSAAEQLMRNRNVASRRQGRRLSPARSLI